MNFNDLVDKVNSFAAATLGEPVEFLLNGISDISTSGIYDESVEVFSPGETDLTEFHPAVTVPSTAISGVTRSHIVSVRGSEYRIFSPPRPDGQGMTHIILVKR